MIFSVAYLFTESIWVLMVLHATVDITSMLAGWASLEHGECVEAGESREDKGE